MLVIDFIPTNMTAKAQPVGQWVLCLMQLGFWVPLLVLVMVGRAMQCLFLALSPKPEPVVAMLPVVAQDLSPERAG